MKRESAMFKLNTLMSLIYKRKNEIRKNDNKYTGRVINVMASRK